MNERIPVYVFRDSHFASVRDTVVCAAPLEVVVSVFGGGGVRGEGGLSAAFGGTAVLRNEAAGPCYLGVWGARNASRFRTALRRGGVFLTIVRKHPPARLVSVQRHWPRPTHQRR